MDDGQVFAAIADERRALADFLDTLTDEQWAVPSLCQGWMVSDVAAHLVMPLITSKPRFVIEMAKARGNFDKANIALTARVVRSHFNHFAELLRGHADSRFTPPAIGPQAPLTDVVVHGQDIRRPLGQSRSFNVDRQRVVLDFLVTPTARRMFRSPSGIRWKAIDLDWSHGNGPQVEGPAEALMLTLSGRPAARADLSGEGTMRLPNQFKP
ncbi:hypothetical protein A5739_23445 [Mycobacterium colombiense]|uniref:maleylpyruvate isomerase family mycothiol-dependent enzyme n=1 Tax=Mycobacterium colombiense TaxID=339268 RepID=UPI00096E435A|nr:maleylpyruvate isomerase family mycothiol-dependent enzyme [Mycobacterium colombiense]OMC24976.1 hypothetical protein A5739_23445 [Mycobacterium colombiense]